jgi:hypothetical protein
MSSLSLVRAATRSKWRASVPASVAAENTWTGGLFTCCDAQHAAHRLSGAMTAELSLVRAQRHSEELPALRILSADSGRSRSPQSIVSRLIARFNARKRPQADSALAASAM